MKSVFEQSISFELLKGGETRTASHVSYFPVKNNQVISLVNVASSVEIAEHANEGLTLLEFGGVQRPFRALWDTGAINTVVEPSVVDEMELVSETWTTIQGVDGNAVDLPTYDITIVQPKFLMGSAESEHGNVISLYPVTAIKLEKNGQLGNVVDILIGMDIISKTDFSLSRGQDGAFWCGIRHPSSGFRTLFDGLN